MTNHIWTIAETKARLSEILRLASSEGPQRIGAQKRYVVVPEALWNKLNKKRKPLGIWLVENMPRATTDDPEFELPSRVDPPRRPPFDDEAL